MGLMTTLFNVVMGPLILYGLLVGHTICRIYFQTPDPIKVKEFPSKDGLEKIVAERQELIVDTMLALNGTFEGDYVAKWGSKRGIEFEDPFQKYEGDEEFGLLLRMAKDYCKSIDFDIYGVHHGPDEIVLDWTMNITASFLPNYSLQVPMRSHLMLDDDEPQKVWRMFEEWKGNKQLNEETTVPFLGRLHQNLRIFTGYLGAESAKRGWI